MWTTTILFSDARGQGQLFDLKISFYTELEPSAIIILGLKQFLLSIFITHKYFLFTAGYLIKKNYKCVHVNYHLL